MWPEADFLHGEAEPVVGAGDDGAMMATMGTLLLIGNMVGIRSAWIGLFVHLMISARIGGSFAVLLDASGQRGGVGSGLAYGLAWWVLGTLTLMPFFLGMGLRVNWNVAAIEQAMPSLVGHLIFGGILGVTYKWLRERTGTPHEGHGESQAA